MRSRDQVIWDFVQSWLKKAEQDLKTAKHLMERKWEDYFNVAFHCQQAVEKYIKAYLTRNQTEFRKTHNLQELADLVSKTNEVLASNLGFSTWLTDFAVEFRYPGEESISKDIAEKALAEAQKVKEFVLGALNEYISKGRP